MKETKVQTNKPRKIDMSAKAVTARIKRACWLGEAEMLASSMHDATTEMRTGKTNPGVYPHWLCK